MKTVVSCSPIRDFRGNFSHSRAVVNPSHVKRFKVCSPVHLCNHKSPVMKTICRGPYKGRFHTSVKAPERGGVPCQPDYELCNQTACQRNNCILSSSTLHFHVCQQTPSVPDPQWVIFAPWHAWKICGGWTRHAGEARRVSPGHEQPSRPVYGAAVAARCKTKKKRYHEARSVIYPPIFGLYSGFLVSWRLTFNRGESPW